LQNHVGQNKFFFCHSPLLAQVLDIGESLRHILLDVLLLKFGSGLDLDMAPIFPATLQYAVRIYEIATLPNSSETREKGVRVNKINIHFNTFFPVPKV
jgi:hypothetical protein